MLREALRHVISGKGKVQSDAAFFFMFKRVLELSSEEIQKIAKGYIWSHPQRCSRQQKSEFDAAEGVARLVSEQAMIEISVPTVDVRAKCFVRQTSVELQYHRDEHRQLIRRP